MMIWHNRRVRVLHESAHGSAELWHKALLGEDEGEELDRARVERKIREAQTTLDGK